MTGETIAEEEEEVDMTPDQLEVRIGTLLDTCTYTVFNYTRRGLFDRDKLIVLTLLTFQILLKDTKIDAAEYEALCKGARSAAPPPITDDLSRWMNEGQWAAVDALAGVPGELWWAVHSYLLSLSLLLLSQLEATHCRSYAESHHRARGMEFHHTCRLCKPLKRP